MTRKLTREAFRAWLAEKPRRVFSGEPGFDWDCKCPLGRYTNGSGLDATDTADGPWADEFLSAVDESTDAVHPRITARRCIKILDAIK